MTLQSLGLETVRSSLLRRLNRYTPVAMLYIDGVSLLFYNAEIYPEVYIFIVNHTGHSTLVMLYFAANAYLKRACLYTYVSIVSMFLLNIINTLSLPERYYELYASTIIFAGMAFATILILKRCIQHSYR